MNGAPSPLWWDTVRRHRPLRIALLVFYYAAIIAGLVALYGRGDFSTPPFVYQGF